MKGATGEEQEEEDKGGSQADGVLVITKRSATTDADEVSIFDCDHTRSFCVGVGLKIEAVPCS